MKIAICLSGEVTTSVKFDGILDHQVHWETW